jgi:NitT/TauT family transport system substrate-binding protein
MFIMLLGRTHRFDKTHISLRQFVKRIASIPISCSIAVMFLVGCDSKPPEMKSLSFDEALAKVRQAIPASQYFTNEFLEKAQNAPPASPANPDKIKIGMPWILNDEGAIWYVAIEKGFFKDVGIEAELVPGGPGKDPLALLVGGTIDIAIAPGGNAVPKLIASPTGSKVVAICTLLKDSPYGWISLDKSVPPDQKSTRQTTPADLIGKTVGLQADGDPYAQFIFGRHQIPQDKVKLVQIGFSTDPLVAGVVDFCSVWIQNQPRFLEQQGHKNWSILLFKNFGWNEHNDVSVVTKSMTEKRPELVTRYLAAMLKAVQFYLDHPDETADITIRYGKDATLDKATVLRRFELERDLVIGHDGKPPLWMSEEVWNTSATLLTQYGVINLK